jgi:hypothetical protein
LTKAQVKLCSIRIFGPFLEGIEKLICTIPIGSGTKMIVPLKKSKISNGDPFGGRCHTRTTPKYDGDD